MSGFNNSTTLSSPRLPLVGIYHASWGLTQSPMPTSWAVIGESWSVSVSTQTEGSLFSFLINLIYSIIKT